MTITDDDAMNAYAKWSSNGGTANTFGPIWKWMKKNDKENALLFKVNVKISGKLEVKKIRGIPGYLLPAMPQDQCVIRLPKGLKFKVDRSLFGIGAELQAVLGAKLVLMLIEPGFRPDGVLRLVTLKNIANK